MVLDMLYVFYDLDLILNHSLSLATALKCFLLNRHSIIKHFSGIFKPASWCLILRVRIILEVKETLFSQLPESFYNTT